MNRIHRQLFRVLLMSMLVAASTVANAQEAKAQEDGVDPVKVGDQAPNFTVATDDEELAELKDYLQQHKVVALVFVRAHW